MRCAIATAADCYDIIILVETWLNDSFSDSELGLINYNIFRLDRCPNNSIFLRGGGVLIAVHKKWISSNMELLFSNVEHLFVDVHLGHKRVIVGSVYFPSG